MNRSFPLYHRQFYRKGIASFEFAMVLPIFLVLWCGVFYTFYAVMMQSDTEIKCRNTTWKKRNDSPLSQPFEFQESANRVIESKISTPIVSGVFFDKFNLSSHSHHILYAGTWDFQQIKMESTAFYRKKDIQRLLINVKINYIISEIEKIAKNILEKIQNEIKRNFANININPDNLASKISDLTSQAEQQIGKVKEGVNKAKNQMQGVVDKCKDKIEDVQQTIDNIKSTLEQSLQSFTDAANVNLNNILTMSEAKLQEAVDRISNLAKEDKEKLENAQDRFIEENIDKLKEMIKQNKELQDTKKIMEDTKDTLGKLGDL